MPSDIPVSGLAAPFLYGTGSPALQYNADAAMAGVGYMQTDGLPGSKFWLCTYNGSTYQWENVRSPVTVQSSATFPNTPIASLGSQSMTITVPGATVNLGVYCAILGAPATPLMMASGYVSAANTVVITLTNFGLTSVTPTNTVVHFFLF